MKCVYVLTGHWNSTDKFLQNLPIFLLGVKMCIYVFKDYWSDQKFPLDPRESFMPPKIQPVVWIIVT